MDYFISNLHEFKHTFNVQLMNSNTEQSVKLESAKTEISALLDHSLNQAKGDNVATFRLLASSITKIRASLLTLEETNAEMKAMKSRFDMISSTFDAQKESLFNSILANEFDKFLIISIFSSVISILARFVVRELVHLC